MKDRKREAIVLNRMYTGGYLYSNLGHEIINLFQADNGEHYLYLNATGDFNNTHQHKVKYMLLTMLYATDVLEVLAMAEFNDKEDDVYGKGKGSNKEEKRENEKEAQIDYINNRDVNNHKGIKYGGVSLLDIFRDAEQQEVCISFRAKTLLTPDNKRLFIAFSKNAASNVKETNAIIAILNNHNFGKETLKQYFYPTDKRDKTGDDYQEIINKLISPKDNWRENNNRIDLKKHLASPSREISLFDICMLQNSELAFSNALGYYLQLPKYKRLWIEFFKTKGFTLSEKFTVTREESATIAISGMKADEIKQIHGENGGRIDLLIRDYDDNNEVTKLIIIENKIESGINRSSKDSEGTNQLERYWNYARWLAKKDDNSSAEVCGLVLHPNYSVVETTVKNPHDKDMSYRPITYFDLYDFLNKKKCEYKEDANFVAFVDAMKRHTFRTISEYMRYEMEEKFYSRIIEMRNEQR